MDITGVFLKIGFIQRYTAIAGVFPWSNAGMEKYSVETASKIFYDLGYETRFFKSERFFRVTSRAENYECKFHARLIHGTVEMMIYIRNGDYIFKPCGSFSWIPDEMGYPQSTRINPPSFSSYGDLAKILEEGLSIYEDVKKEFLEFVGANRNA